MKIICLAPVYNDWTSLSKLVAEILLEAQKYEWELISIVAVNDCSSEDYDYNLFPKGAPLQVINLAMNLGHQRAIAIGLSYIQDNFKNYDGVVVMDSDGEDKPENIVKLLQKAEASSFSKVVFAKRGKRSESFFFRLFYIIYKLVFRLLTNNKISFGNFSFIPATLLLHVISLPDLWNHYSGSIVRSRLIFDTVPIDRGKRYFGESKMNFNSLILHGLSSISIYLDVVTVKLLITTTVGFFIAILSLITVFIIRIFTSYSIPGWASNISLTLANIILVMLIILLLLLFHLNQRSKPSIPMMKLYKDFILSVNSIKN